MPDGYYRRGHFVTGPSGKRFYRRGHWVGATAGGIGIVGAVLLALLFFGVFGGDPAEPRREPAAPAPAPAVRTVTPGTTLAPDPDVTDLPDIVIEE